MSTTVSSATDRTERDLRSSTVERPSWEAISRGVAMFWGLFLLFQVFLWGEMYSAWWLGDLPFPLSAQRGGSAFFAVLLIFYAVSDQEPRLLRGLTWSATGLILGFCLLQVWSWYSAKEAGLFSSASDVPLVLQVTAILAVIFAGLSQPAKVEGGRRGGLLLSVIAFDLTLVAFPLAHLYCLGQTTDAIPSRTILLAVDDLPDASSKDLMRLSQVFPEDQETQLILMGSTERTTRWQQSLSPLISKGSIEVSLIDTAEQLSLQQIFVELANQSEHRSMLIAGSPITLSVMRVRALRAGLHPRQLLLTQDRLPISTALATLPELWLTYVPIRKQDRM